MKYWGISNIRIPSGSDAKHGNQKRIGDDMSKHREYEFLLLVGVLALSGCSSESQQADDFFHDATVAQAAGRTDEALRLLDQSLETEPTSYVYFQRAKLRLEIGDDAGTIADCEAGLTLAPSDRDLLWLLAEARKPKGRRFQSDYAEPPSRSK